MNGVIRLIWIQISARRNGKTAKRRRLQYLNKGSISQVTHTLFLLFTIARVLG